MELFYLNDLIKLILYEVECHELMMTIMTKDIFTKNIFVT